jgi:hypothetical protein
MVEILRILLGVLVVASLATIVAYVVVFLGVAAWAVLTRSRRDPLADELDSVLAEIVGPRVPLAPAARALRSSSLRGEVPPERWLERADPFAAGRFS